MNITQRVIEVREAIAGARGALSVADDGLSVLLAHGVGLEQRIANAEPIIDAVYTILTEEHPELADMLYEGLQALRGRQAAPVERERAA